NDCAIFPKLTSAPTPATRSNISFTICEPNTGRPNEIARRPFHARRFCHAEKPQTRRRHVRGVRRVSRDKFHGDCTRERRGGNHSCGRNSRSSRGETKESNNPPGR